MNLKNLSLQNKQYNEKIFQLNARTDELSHELSELSGDNEASRNTIQLLNQKLAELDGQKEQEAVVAKQFKEAAAELKKEHLQQQLEWQGERALLEQQLKAYREKVRLGKPHY